MITINIPYVSQRKVFYLPAYKPGKYRNWRLIKHRYMPPFLPGYFNKLEATIPDLNYALLHINPHTKKQSVWMSLTMMELQSQIIHSFLPQRTRTIALLGIGMGAMLHHLRCVYPRVDIYAVESSKSIINLLPRIIHPKQLQYLMDRTVIINEDAMKWLPTRRIDVVIADIWEHVGDDNVLTDMREIHKNIQPKISYAWGQEIVFIDWLAKKQIARHDAMLQPGMVWREFISAHRIPSLAIPKCMSWQSYVRLCFRIAEEVYL